MFAFKTLEEKYRSIPDDVREAISSSEVNRKLRELTDKYKLQFDEAEELTKEIGFVMLGLKHSDNFVKNIQKATALDYPTSKKIAEDVNNLIFTDIRESLKKIHQSADDEEILDEKEIRNELIKEIESPTAPITDLVKLPDAEQNSADKINIAIPTDDNKTQADTPKEKDLPTKTQPAQSTPTTKRNPPKKYIIDPYREPMD